MDKSLNKRIDEFKEEIIRVAQELIRVKSIEDKPEEGMPFGRGVNEALETALEAGNILGFKTKNVDGYAGHIEIGDGEEIMGILCHLDVVPEGTSWDHAPYGAEIYNNKIYGRGSIDNKGPIAAALYAMKAVIDCGFKLNKRVRLILGTDEESGWEGLEYYLEKEKTPDFAFSPDAEFPVIHAEKGIVTFKLSANFNDRKNVIEYIKGGNAPNMVPDYCEVLLSKDNFEIIEKEFHEFIKDTGYSMEKHAVENGVVIRSQGKSAHGSLPGDGHNAISQLMVFLNKLNIINGDVKEFISFYDEKIGMDYHGEKIGCALEDDISGKLTFNVGMIDVTQDSGEFVVNIRYPIKYTKDDVISKIKEEMKKSDIHFELEVDEHYMEPLYVDKKDKLVQNLMKVYRDLTGDKSEPIAIGGGTYARAVEKAVAFGPLFPGQEELAHQRNEYIGIKELILNAKIYANAIIELAAE
ncbi:MAG: dipeptidase PepV [Halothermotrichaceae bacterium]